MKIKSLHIKNFKSILDINIKEPNPFSVFVGPNGSGKSNIFEALEFCFSNNTDKTRLFGGVSSLVNKKLFIPELNFFSFGCLMEVDGYNVGSSSPHEFSYEHYLNELGFGLRMYPKSQNPELETAKKKYFNFVDNLSHLFIKNKEKQKVNYPDDFRLSFSCDNLEKVLKRLLDDDTKREEINEWLSLFIPEFDRIEVQKSEFSSNENLLIYQKHYQKPFNRELISDGTHSIIALLTAVYQSDEPQFLCIEEPENGLHPKVIKQLVNFFRDACEEKGHYIWLNTHSQSLVSALEPKEIILVDKKNGETQIKQFNEDFNLHGFEMDEAWLSNALGGGLPW